MNGLNHFFLLNKWNFSKWCLWIFYCFRTRRLKFDVKLVLWKTLVTHLQPEVISGLFNYLLLGWSQIMWCSGINGKYNIFCNKMLIRDRNGYNFKKPKREIQMNLTHCWTWMLYYRFLHVVPNFYWVKCDFKHHQKAVALRGKGYFFINSANKGLWVIPSVPTVAVNPQHTINKLSL